jgi:phosphoglycolate phosphatase
LGSDEGSIGLVKQYPSTIVFDLDGTLVDTAPDLTSALNHALGVLGRPPVPADDVRHMVGHGARKLLERGLAASGPVSQALIEAGVPAFLDYYWQHIADGSQPFPGVEAALDRLAGAGCKLAVCTNKPVALAQALIAALGWTARFEAVLGFDSVPLPKPDPGHVWATIEAAGGDVEDAAFVGDSMTDVAAARAAGVPVVVVSFGFSDRPPAALGADAVIDHYDALDAALALMVQR